LLLGVGMVAAVVATDGALLLRARSRTRGMSLGHQVVLLDLLEFEVITDGVEGEERL
jgi:hypothetical protein